MTSMGRTKDAETANDIILFSSTLGGRPDARPRSSGHQNVEDVQCLDVGTA